MAGTNPIFVPGPTNVPHRIRQAIDIPMEDHRAPDLPAFTLPLLKDRGLRDYFELVVSGDSLPARKPDPLPLLHTCEHFGITPGQGVLVGDSANDTRAAQAAGMPVICVTYGYNQGIDIRDLEPDAVIDSLDELPNYIRLA